jgi:hypothetical protein
MTKACLATSRRHTQLEASTPLQLMRTTTESDVQEEQPNARTSVKYIRSFTLLLWALFITVAIWTLVVGFVALRIGSNSASHVKSLTNKVDALAYWNTYGSLSIKYDYDLWTERRDWAGMLIQSFALAPFTLSLHAAEVITHVSRDEAVWRKTATVGALVDGSTLREEWGNLETRVLFLFKAIIPWVFGNALSCNLSVWMALLPLCVLTLLCGLLVAFAERVGRMKRKGTQPTTYGNILTLMYLVDEWDHRRIFWGDKGMERPGVRRAGTSGVRLADLDRKSRYINIAA